MLIFRDLAELRLWRKQQSSLAFVPTMGNLHEGHISLVKQAQQNAQSVVVSIFVNPMQFAAHEDLDAYPRTFEQDCEKLKEAGVDAVFAPEVSLMYPNGLTQQTRVEVPDSEHTLIAEAARRPGHFAGVSTVVTKLFNMVQPDVAVFGEKDFQQLKVIKTMVRDLNMPITIIGAPTVREQSGLAKSSRNGYLTAFQLTQAPVIYQALQLVKEALLNGQTDCGLLTELASEMINEAGLKTDYVEIRDADSLAPIHAESKAVVILAAAHLGKARLIDNVTVTLK